MLYSAIFKFYQFPFSTPGSHHIIFSFISYQAPLACQTFLIFNEVDRFEKYWSVFCIIFHIQDLSDVFFIIRLALWVFGRKTPVQCHSHYITARAQMISMICNCMICHLDHIAKVVFVGFSTVKLLFSSFSISYSLEGSHYVQSTLKEQEAMIHVTEGR